MSFLKRYYHDGQYFGFKFLYIQRKEQPVLITSVDFLCLLFHIRKSQTLKKNISYIEYTEHYLHIFKDYKLSM